jgi:dipeptidase
VGGVLWFSVDDTYSTVYFPNYAGNHQVPRSFAAGTADFETFSWDSAFWVFNFVSNWAYSRYGDIIQDVQKVQRELEGGFLSRQAEVERAAVALHQQSPALARDYLTAYSVDQGDRVTARWRKLGESLLVKYLDGNVRDAQGKVTHPDYPEAWRRRMAEEQPDLLLVKPLPGEKEEE